MTRIINSEPSNIQKYTNKRTFSPILNFSHATKTKEQINRTEESTTPLFDIQYFHTLKTNIPPTSRSFDSFLPPSIPSASPMHLPPKFNSTICILHHLSSNIVTIQVQRYLTLYLPDDVDIKARGGNRRRIEESSRYCIHNCLPPTDLVIFRTLQFQLHLSTGREKKRPERSSTPPPPPFCARNCLPSFRSCVISSRSCSSKTNRITGSGRSGREL